MRIGEPNTSSPERGRWKEGLSVGSFSEHMKRREWWTAGLMLIPVVGAASYIGLTRSYQRLKPSSHLADSLVRTDGRFSQAPQVLTPRQLVARKSARRASQQVDMRTVAAEAPSAPSSYDLTKNPGPHFGDEIADAVLERWQAEHYDVTTSPMREQSVTDVFRDNAALGALQEVNCRESLCRLTLDGPTLGENERARIAASKLGRDVAILENNESRVVVLVSVGAVDALGTSG
jgi:hypothetical protein